MPLVDYITDDDAALLQLSEKDAWCLRDAYEGVQIFGGTGSGKSSGSGRTLARAYLNGGMGGIVLCAKPGEAETWQRYAEECGRADSILHFDASGSTRFNFLEYEMRRAPDAADTMSSNVVNLLMSVLEVAARGAGMSASGGGNDPFWQKSARMFLGYAVDLLYATTGRVRLAEIANLIESAPKSTLQMEDKRWQASSFLARILKEFYATGGGRFPPPVEDAARMIRFWTHNFPSMAEKTRENIITTISADLDPLLKGRMRTLFSTETTIVPEFAHDGYIILLDFPVKEWAEAGILAQQIFKYLFQRSTERRRVDAETRPVFLWADECQFFLSSYDMEFQSTARSARACTVLLSQNLPTFYSRVGGQVPEHTVNALLGNLRTKILHANDDPVTNEWGSKIVGRETVWRQTHGQNAGWSEGSGDGESLSHAMTYSTEGWSHNQSQSVNVSNNYGTSGGQNIGASEQKDYAIDPGYFSSHLLTGGTRNHRAVTAILIQSGRQFQHTKRHWIPVCFPQV